MAIHWPVQNLQTSSRYSTATCWASNRGDWAVWRSWEEPAIGSFTGSCKGTVSHMSCWDACRIPCSKSLIEVACEPVRSLPCQSLLRRPTSALMASATAYIVIAHGANPYMLSMMCHAWHGICLANPQKPLFLLTFSAQRTPWHCQQVTQHVHL